MDEIKYELWYSWPESLYQPESLIRFSDKTGNRFYFKPLCNQYNQAIGYQDGHLQGILIYKTDEGYKLVGSDSLIYYAALKHTDILEDEILIAILELISM